MGNVFGSYALHLMAGVMRRRSSVFVACVMLTACIGTAPPEPTGVQPVQPPPSLPDADGWGVHVLAIAGGPNRVSWAGTWDGRLYRIGFRAGEWEAVTTSQAAAGPITSVGFERDSLVVWYGTAGGGFARSPDAGESWRAWPQGGGAWNHVVHRGILMRRDTVFVATTDGIRYTGDAGATWRCIQAPRPAGSPAPAEDGCTERLETLPNGHLLSMELGVDGSLHIGHLRGLSRSTDRGRTWTEATAEGLAGERVRSVRLGPDTTVWALTERALFAGAPRSAEYRRIDLRVPGYPELPGFPRALISQPGALPVLIATSYGLLAETASGAFRMHFLSAADRYRPAGDIWTAAWWGPPMIPLGGAAAGINRVLAGESPIPAFLDMPPRVEPAAGRHLRFQRPVRDEDGNPFAAGTELFGMTGTPSTTHLYQNPAGTPVRTIGAGAVVRAGEGRVVVRHDGAVDGHVVYSSYQFGGPVQATVGQRVEAGATLGTVGRDVARTSGVRLSIHAVTPNDTAVARPDMVLPGAVNPALWLEPRPGTGIVAGRVMTAAGAAVTGAQVHGLVVAYPTEAPFSRAFTYPAGLAGSPAYGEHFAVGDVPAGDYTLGVTIEGQRVWRRVRVVPGQVSWVEFRP
jgi:murein DD-endopeptidase MepM/ murein hydrolase activator NlpD